MNALPMVQPPAGDTPLTVALLSLPERTEAVLEFFFSHHGGSHFRATGEDHAQAAVFDLDTAESLQHWQAWRSRTGRPGIALSVSPHEIDGAVWVRKPITPAALVEAVAAVSQLAEAGQIRQLAPAPSNVVTLPHAEPDTRPALATAVSGPAEITTPVAEEPVIPAISPPVDDAGSDDPTPPAATPASPAPRVTTAPTRWWQRLLSWWRQPPAPPAPTPPPATSPATTAIEGGPATEVATRSDPAPERAPAPGRPDTPACDSAASSAPGQGEPEASTPVDSPDRTEEVPVPPSPVEESDKPEGASAPPSRPPEPELPDDGQRPVPPEERANDARLCGTREDRAVADFATEAALRWSPARQLIGALMEATAVARKWQVPSRVEVDGLRICIDTRRNLLHVEPGFAALAGLQTRVLARHPKTHTLSHAEVQAWEARRAEQGETRRLDEALWCCALESADGRWPDDLQVDAPLYLRHWPNLTRLPRTPHAMRIAALWSTRGATLEDTARRLRIAQRHVLAFCNAARALDLVTHDETQRRQTLRRGARNRNALSRLMGWLSR